jgi:hypothetical protein
MAKEYGDGPMATITVVTWRMESVTDTVYIVMFMEDVTKDPLSMITDVEEEPFTFRVAIGLREHG